jgi:glycosyltransferase involved in cell wall biosynthesis
MTRSRPARSAPSNPDLPLVSVVIPTRDRPELVRRAVASVLAQTYAGDIECIVVADQAEAPRELPEPARPGRAVAVIDNGRTPGLAGARNTGILASRAPLLAFLDDDDEWLPEKLERQAAVLAREPEAGLVGCAIEIELP